MKDDSGLVDNETQQMVSSGQITPILLLQNGRSASRLQLLARQLKIVFRSIRMANGMMIAAKVRALQTNVLNE